MLQGTWPELKPAFTKSELKNLFSPSPPFAISLGANGEYGIEETSPTSTKTAGTTAVFHHADGSTNFAITCRCPAGCSGWRSKTMALVGAISAVFLPRSLCPDNRTPATNPPGQCKATVAFHIFSCIRHPDRQTACHTCIRPASKSRQHHLQLRKSHWRHKNTL